MKRIIPFLFLLAACHQQGKPVIHIKRIEDSLVALMNDSIVYYYQASQYDSMTVFLNNIKTRVDQYATPKLKLYWELANIQKNTLLNQKDSTRKHMAAAYQVVQNGGLRAKDSVNFFIIYDQWLFFEGYKDSAIVIATEAYHLAKRSDTLRIATTSLDLSKYYDLINDLPNSHKYLVEAWNHREIEQELKMSIGVKMADYYDRIGKLDSAIYYFEQSERDSTLKKMPAAVADSYENAGLFLGRKGKYKEGLQFMLKAKALNDSIGRTGNTLSYINIAQTYEQLKAFSTSIAYLDTAIAVASANRNPEELKLAWQAKATTFSSMGNYQKAYDAMDSAMQHFTVEVDSSLRLYARELETKYEVKDKDNEIKTLALTNAASQKIRNQQKITIIALIIAALLIATIVILLWRRRKTQMALREMDLRQQILRAQMDPHFIFNSLAILQGIIHHGDSKRANHYISSLGKLLRFTFDNARGTFVLLNSEVEALEAYLYLQRTYKADVFDYDIRIYDGYQEDEIYIPPMLLQPFLENTIQHGFQGIDYKGHLSVIIEKQNNALRCIVLDNGKGLPPENNTGKIHSTGINKERLSILEKQTHIRASLNIIDRKTTEDVTGVRIEVIIPFSQTNINWFSKQKRNKKEWLS